MQQEEAKQPEEETGMIEDDPSWQALQQCQMTLPLGRLLQLVLRFTKSLKSTLAPLKPVEASAYFTNPSDGPTMVGNNCLVLTVIMKGK